MSHLDVDYPPDTPRNGLYFWVTWLTGLMAGEKHCVWAAWYRGRMKYQKRPDDQENTLAVWKGVHAARVRERTQLRLGQGYGVVRVEEQNRFHYRGRLATVGGCPDVVALTGDGRAVLDDVKTGKPRDSDFWQVATYGLLVPLVSDTRKLFEGCVVEGTVSYNALDRCVSSADIKAAEPRIIATVQMLATAAEPARTPSAHECGWCDILRCPDRVLNPDADETAETGALF